MITDSDALTCLQCSETHTTMNFDKARDPIISYCRDYKGRSCRADQDICTTTIVNSSMSTNSSHLETSMTEYGGILKVLTARMEDPVVEVKQFSVLRDCGSMSAYRADKNAICNGMDSETMPFSSIFSDSFDFSKCQTEICRHDLCNIKYREVFDLRGTGEGSYLGDQVRHHSIQPYTQGLKPIKARTDKGNREVDEHDSVRRPLKKEPRTALIDGSSSSWNGWEDHKVSNWNEWMGRKVSNWNGWVDYKASKSKGTTDYIHSHSERSYADIR